MMDTIVPVSSISDVENGSNQYNNGYFTPKGYLNQAIVKEAEATRESRRIEVNRRQSSTSSEYHVPVSPSSRFPPCSPLIVISPPKDDSTPITVVPTTIQLPISTIPDSHRRSLIVAIIAALLVFIAVICMLLLVLNT